jgi:hypothetical protein
VRSFDKSTVVKDGQSPRPPKIVGSRGVIARSRWNFTRRNITYQLCSAGVEKQVKMHFEHGGPIAVLQYIA